MYMRSGPAALILLLAACNTGSPEFLGVVPQRVTIGQSTFDVRRKDDRVEVLRMSREPVFSLAAIVPRATQAVIAATGCVPRPESWTGDQAMARVTVDCPDDDHPG